jgi:hypothetical protein
MRTPALWPAWPYLALVRRRPGREEELGALYDALGASGLTGFSATVFICNIYLLPTREAEFLALPKEVYDTAEEVARAGWAVD